MDDALQDLLFIQQEEKYNPIYLYELRRTLLRIFTQYRGYHPHPDLSITKQQFLEAYRHERLQPDGLHSFLTCMQMCVNKTAPADPYIAGSYQAVPAVVEIKPDAEPDDKAPPPPQAKKECSFTTPQDCVLTVLIHEDTIGIDTTRILISFLKHINPQHVFVIITGKLTPQAGKSLRESLQDVDIEIFDADVIACELMENTLNPQIVLKFDSQAKAKFLQDTHFVQRDLPNYPKEDPVVRICNFKDSDAVELVHRNSNKKYFRVVGNSK